MEYIVISSDSSSEYSNSDDDLYTAINYNGDIDSHVRAGNPLQPCPFKRKYFQSVRRRRKKMSIASAVEENDEDFDQFDLQKAISNSLQVRILPPVSLYNTRPTHNFSHTYKI